MSRIESLRVPVRTMILCLALVVPGLVAVGATPSGECADCRLSAMEGVCVDFEALPPSSEYLVGDAFVDSGAVLTLEPFVWANGSLFHNGVATVDNAGSAGGGGLDLATNNVNVAFDFGVQLTRLSLRFGHYGGNLNVSVNGSLRNRFEFAQLDGITIAGVRLTVVGGPEQGTLHLRGPIHKFAIGGQELWIDDVCPSGPCVNWEELTLGAEYRVGDGFIHSGVPVQARAFQWSSGQFTSGGVATVGNGGLAGGRGLEMHANNINLHLEFKPSWSGLSLRYGEYGGNVNLGINGDTVNIQSFGDLPQGGVLGGVRVWVQPVPQSDMGTLLLEGAVHTLLIGGQELWLDDICPDQCCATFAAVPPGASFHVGEGIHELCTSLSFGPFQQSGGGWTDQGLATVGTQELAGGDGPDLALNNITAAFEIQGADGVRLHFGEYGGNVNLEINGVLVNVEDLAELNGQEIAGVFVSVVNGHGNDKGVLTLKGPLSHFGIGGQELWIDDVCERHLPPSLFIPLARRR